MKIFKPLRKRGLALFLVLTMCMSLLPANALAAEVEEATHICNEDGWTCVEESKLTCGYEYEHTYDETCGLTEDGSPACGLAEHTHEGSCYGSVWTHTKPSENVELFLRAAKDLPQEVAAEDEAVIAHARSAYDALDEAAKAEESVVNALAKLEAAEAVLAEIKAAAEAEAEAAAALEEAVQAFLAAVSAIPEITVENAVEVSEYLYGECADLYETLLETEAEELPEVQAAAEAMGVAMNQADEQLGILAAGFAGSEDSDALNVTVTLEIFGAKCTGGKDGNHDYVWVNGREVCQCCLKGKESVNNQYTVKFVDNYLLAEEVCYYEETVSAGKQVQAPSAPDRPGFTFLGWVDSLSGTVQPNEKTAAIYSNSIFYAAWRTNPRTAYTVEHYKQDVGGTGYTLAETEPLTGETGTIATAVAKTYTGFTENTIHPDRVPSGPIAGDGSLVLKLYYDLKQYTVIAEVENGTVDSGNDCPAVRQKIL